jgi:hypothetical protein
VSDELDLRRIEEIMLLTAHGQEPGIVTFAEQAVVKRFAEQMVRNWQATGVLPPTREAWDLRPEDVAYAHRRWASLGALRLDPSVGWRRGQSLRGLLRTAPADRLPTIKVALRGAGIGVPSDEWEPPGEPA